MLSIFVIIVSGLLTIHAVFTLIWMLYAWEDPDYAELHSSPRSYVAPRYSFTALLPAKDEAQVIGQTIKSISQINYPQELMETLVLIRYDDTETLIAAQRAIDSLKLPNIHIVYINTSRISKPTSLNQGLKFARGEMVAVFDAEDQPHPEIYNSVNTVVTQENVDIVQGGVQLMNYKSSWFSLMNVLEYFFWFKSGLHFFTRFAGVTPLGGNTVFFKRQYLNAIGGWDEDCLTEDAEIGIRLVTKGAKVRVFYNAELSTQEETPPDTGSFIKQRTRWNQGFLQIFSKGEWTRLPSIKQKLLMMYLLLSPEIQSIMFLYTFVGFFIAVSQKLPTFVALFSFVPFYLFIIQMTVYFVGIFEFTSSYKKPFPLFEPFRLLVSYIPYNTSLLYSATRALLRFFLNNNNWEKTEHVNAHRKDFIKENYAQG